MTQREFNAMLTEARKFTPSDVANAMVRTLVGLHEGALSQNAARNAMNILKAQSKWLSLEGFLDENAPPTQPMED